ncbi:hypothetical protein ACZ87_02854 [Candidatus Erwinia dacicola]|uniref:Uncharacterized protein n=1 Tax=Candidatus Erwinia dacicola TaxID=252393 RepID=A0A328TLV4_9GAMM|nr:hypothetical protein ACZ87_02854 [Candidatus Erwinia dacicola]
MVPAQRGDFLRLLAEVGYFLVCTFASEAAGSGIPEIEGALEELCPAMAFG